MTVSFGVAELQRGEGREGWLNRADGALFRAKGEGRNRVVLCEALAEERFVAIVAAGGESFAQRTLEKI